MTTILFLVATVLAHALVAAQDGYGSGSGGGEACRRPMPTPRLPYITNKAAAVRELQCHLACIDRISVREGFTFQVSTEYPAWPNIPDSELERNCSINMMVQKCRKGCKSNGCKCKNEECFNNTDPNSCQICNREYCQEGCTVGKELQVQLQKIPPNPVAPLALTYAESEIDLSDAGLYYINATNAAPSEHNQRETRYPTGFIIRVSHLHRDDIKYIIMTSFDGILNLSSFSCEQVRIQYGVVNKFGRANFSFAPLTSQTVNITGEDPPMYAQHPMPEFHVLNDDRTGFWKHASIEISLERPRGFELVESYKVTFNLDESRNQTNCSPSKPKVVTVKKSSGDTTKHTIKAESIGDGPVSDCYYTLQVESVPMRSSMTSPQNATIKIVHVPSSKTTPVPLDFICNRTWDEKSGNYTYKVDWSVPEDDVNVTDAISSFEVVVDLVAPDLTAVKLHSTPYSFNMSDNSSFVYHHSQQVQYNHTGYSHRIMMISHPSDLPISVLVPAPRACEFEAGADPPAQVENVKTQTTKKSLSGSTFNLDLIIVWTPVPTDPSYYELRIVNDNTTNSAHNIHTEQTSEPLAKVTGLRITPDTRRPCLYVQVRAVSHFMAEGPWSEFTCIELPPVPSPLPVSTALPIPPKGVSTGNSGGGSGGGQVVYISISVGVLLIACVATVAVIIFLACHPSRRNRKNRLRVDPVFMTRKASDKDKYSCGKLDQWEVYSNQVAIQNQLGEGAFGYVYCGMFNSAITDKSNVKAFDANNSVVVAVKLLRDDAPDRDRQIFLKHILQAKKVAQYQNPHLVCLVGCVTEQEPLSLLTEYPEQGDLLTYLRTQRQEILKAQLQQLDCQNGIIASHKAPNTVPKSGSELSLQAQDLMMFISHVAAGLEHLASIGVVHGDVACRNLFLTADKVVKIADFGLDSASEEEQGLVYMESELGRMPIRWMAIESLRDGEFSTSSDVWSFGITLWEIASLGGFPYHDTANSDILATLSAGQRLECPTNCSEEIHGIMLKCCAAVPNDRPSFSTLHHVFKSLHATANDSQYITLNIDRAKSYYFASPRSSAVIETHIMAEDFIETQGTDPAEVAIVTQHTTSGGAHLPPVHSRTASYTCSETTFLPCITEEGEDASDNDDETMGVREKLEVRDNDSGNDSTFSHESRKHHKDSDRDDSEENLVMPGTMELL